MSTIFEGEAKRDSFRNNTLSIQSFTVPQDRDYLPTAVKGPVNRKLRRAVKIQEMMKVGRVGAG
jgi:hypothetical protein